jgi:hypothetical protein
MKLFVYEYDGKPHFRFARIVMNPPGEFVGTIPIEEPKKTVTRESCLHPSRDELGNLYGEYTIPGNAKNVRLVFDIDE